MFKCVIKKKSLWNKILGVFHCLLQLRLGHRIKKNLENIKMELEINYSSIKENCQFSQYSFCDLNNYNFFLFF